MMFSVFRNQCEFRASVKKSSECLIVCPFSMHSYHGKMLEVQAAVYICLPLTLHLPLYLLDHMAQVADHLVQQLGPTAEPSLILDLTQNYQLLDHLINGLE